MSVLAQGWREMLPGRAGPGAREVRRLLSCAIDRESLLRLQTSGASVQATVRQRLESCSFDRSVLVPGWEITLACPAGIVEVDITDPVPPGVVSVPVTVSGALSSAAGIEAEHLAIQATLAPGTPVSRGQLLALTGANATIVLAPGLYTMVLESTEFWVWSFAGACAVPLTGAAEISSVPCPPWSPVNVYVPQQLTFSAMLVKAGTGNLWIARVS